MAKLSDIANIVKKALASKAILDAGGKASVRAIPRRTRLGKGVQENEGPTHKLPGLQTKTVKNRTRLRRTGALTGPGATPKKSGLNKTGELLDSVTYKVGNKNFTVELETAAQRQKAEALLKIDKDFKFMALSAAEFKRVLKAMTKQVERVLNRINFTDL